MGIGMDKMEEFFKWVGANKNWIFEGIGVAVLSVAATAIIWLFRRRRSPEKSQVQTSGDDSINIQAGHDVRIGNQVGESDGKQANTKKR